MRKTTQTVAAAMLAGLLGTMVARADEWDFGVTPSATDGSHLTPNAMFHGAQQLHDVGGSGGGVADEDWYLVASDQFSSYQFVVDGMTGRVGLVNTTVQRMEPNGGAVAENGFVGNSGGVVTLAWLGPGPGTATSIPYNVRIHGATCGTGCNALDRYRARFYDTTYTVPRFNNSGTQTTILVLQNASPHPCIVAMHFFDGTGALLATSQAGTVNRRQSIVANTAVSVPNKSGTIRVAHTCGYGGLTGKAVSIEPSTGFTFDTALLQRPH